MDVNTILTNSDANAFFGINQITLDNRVLESTLRYIALKHHEGEIEKLKLITTKVSQFDSYSRYGDFITDRYDDVELFIVTAKNGATMPVINEEGWASQDSPPYPVAPFLSKCSETKVYTNIEKRRTVIFVRVATERWITALTSSLFRILPWYFTTMTEEETALFRAVSNGDQDTFVNIINSCCNYNFADMAARRTLMNWGEGYREAQLKTYMDRSVQLMNNMSDYEREIAKILDELSGVHLNIEALQAQKASNSSEVYDFFTARKNIGIASVVSSVGSSKKLRYYVTEVLEYFDKDAFIRVYDNSSSWLAGNPSVREILYGCFVQEKGVIQVEGVFELTNLSSITAVSNIRSGLFEETHLPHPHIYHYACLGNNSSHINEFLRSGEWGMAIDQTVSAIKNINFGDSTVCNAFVRDIAGKMDTCKCIIADNGVKMTPKEFLAYIREFNNQANEEAKTETTEG